MLLFVKNIWQTSSNPTAKQFTPVVQPLRDRLLDLINKKIPDKDFDQLLDDFGVYKHSRKAPTTRAQMIMHLLFILGRGLEADADCGCTVKLDDFKKAE